MIKVAIFVEGQTELIFVRELLLKFYEYQDIALDCVNLFSDHQSTPAEYPYPNPEASKYFEIINVGMDGSVLTRLLKRETALRNAGFTKIIGLRDMYSEAYRKAAGTREIKPHLTDQFVQGHLDQIQKHASRPNEIYFHFAIMETEAWILGLWRSFPGLESIPKREQLAVEMGYDLERIDPETTFFHPANELEKILLHLGKDYGKSKGDVNSIMGKVQRQDLTELYHVAKCQSYTEFCNSLIGSITT